VRAFGAEMVTGERAVGAPVADERLVAYAVDIAGEVALSGVIDRRERPWVRWLQVWQRRGCTWAFAGAAQDLVGSDVLAARIDTGKPRLVRKDAGSLLLQSGRWPWSGRYGCWQTFRASGDLTEVVIEDRPLRHVEVHWHGRVVVGWLAQQRVTRIGPGFGLSAGPSRSRPIVTGVAGTGGRITPEG